MWDLKNYHLYNPFEAYNGRYMVDVAPAQLQSYFNPILDFPFFAFISLFNDRPRLIAFLMGTVQGLNLTAIVLIAWHCLREFVDLSGMTRACLTSIALAIGGTGAAVTPLIGTTTGDLPAAVPILWSLYALLCGIDGAWKRAPSESRDLLIAGILAGAAAGAKLTMALYGIALASSLLTLPWRSWFRGFGVFLLGAIGGFLITGGYHHLNMIRLFGSPTFPLMNGIFHSQYWEIASLRDTRFLPQNLFQEVFYPYIWASHITTGMVTELAFRDMRIAAVLSIGILLVCSSLFNRFLVREPNVAIPPNARALAIFFVVSYLIWLQLFSIYRYLVPLEMLSGVMLMLATGFLIRSLWRRIGALLAAMAVCYVTTVPLEWGHTPFQKHYIEISGTSLPENTLVAIIGQDPVSYFIPFFRKDTTWISLTPNFLNPSQGNLLVQHERDLITNHKGPIMVFAAGALPTSVAPTLASMGMSSDQNECQDVSSNLGSEVYKLCSARRR